MMSDWIKKNERGLLFRRGDFVRVLEPGRHKRSLLRAFLGHDTLTIYDTLETRFQHPLLDLLVTDEDFLAHVHVLELAETQRALVWIDGRLESIVGAGRYVYWKAPRTVAFEVFDVLESDRFEHPKLESILRHPQASQWLAGAEVTPQEELIVFRDGEAVARIGEGRYVHWKSGRAYQLRGVDLREQVADVAGQEIMTRDKVTLRVNLVVTYRVRDALKALTVVTDHVTALYRDAQLALRAAVGVRTLDALLQDKEAVGTEVREDLAARAATFGVEVGSVGLRDIILPGEMKTILNQVIEAQKAAEANVIKRREETAAARSQANTAKLLAENPALQRMKEMEALQEILSGAKTQFVFGQGDLGTQLRTLMDRDAD